MAEEFKKRKIRKTDWQKVEDFLKKELARRKDSDFRKGHERKWKEVDRQIQMEAMQKISANGKPLPASWQSAFELGELSKASEIITADVMRLIFPQARTWGEAHVKPPMTVDPKTGKSVPAVNQSQQKRADAVLWAFMTQQHMDFGLKARVELSVKEALHHGAFVTTAEWEHQNKVHDGQGLESLAAPVWVPHSMWNCYPDVSPSVVAGANIFYPGSMMITSYMPRYKVLALKGEGYMNIDPKKIPKRKNTNKDVDTEDVEIVTYYGDLVIERDDGDIYLPNSKCKTANGVIIYYRANPLPFPEVIYQGYERQDVRDPYFTSCIVKNSPMQKVATILANKFIDWAHLDIERPIVYDGNDPYMVQNGGLNIWPGAQTASKGSNKFQQIEIGDGRACLDGLQMALLKLEEGTSVNALRSGARESDRKTATEVHKTSQGAEVRTVDFVGKLEMGALRPFLYMQHELNLKELKSYSFYCPEKGLPDFLTITKKDLPKVVHFEVVGSKGILGEERRAQQMTAVTAWASATPGFAELLNRPKILMDAYEDAGVKGAEEYVNTQAPQIPPQVQAEMEQLKQALQEAQAELQKAKSGLEVAQQKLEIDARESAAELKFKAAELELKKAEALAAQRNDMQETLATIAHQQAELKADRERMHAELQIQRERMHGEYELKLIQIEKAHDAKMVEIEKKAEEAKAAEKAKPKKKVKIKRTSDGYEASED